MIRNANQVFTMVNEVDDRRFRMIKNVLLCVAIFGLVMTIIECILAIVALIVHFEESLNDYNEDDQEKIRPGIGYFILSALLISLIVISIASLQVYAIYREHFCLVTIFAILDVIAIFVAIARGVHPIEIPLLMCYVLIASLMIYFAYLIRQRQLNSSRISAHYII